MRGAWPVVMLSKTNHHKLPIGVTILERIYWVSYPNQVPIYCIRGQLVTGEMVIMRLLASLNYCTGIVRFSTPSTFP